MFENFEEPDAKTLKIRNPLHHLAEKLSIIQPYSVDSWPEELHQRCVIPRKPFEMPAEVHEMILDGKEIKPEDWPELDNELDGRFSFIRLGGASPKDFMASTSIIAKPDPVPNFATAINALCGSERTLDLLIGHWHSSTTPVVWVSPFITIRPQDEWRCVVKEGRLRAISQYYWPIPADLTDEDALAIKATIAGLYEDLRHLLPQTCVMDVIARPGFAKFLEINPLEFSDLCLILHELPEELTIYHRVSKTRKA